MNDFCFFVRQEKLVCFLAFLFSNIDKKYFYHLLVGVIEFEGILLCFSVVGKGQILLDAQCHIGVASGPQVKVTLTRHESAAVGAGTRDYHLIPILILSRPKFQA